jgi:hypothetical protein
MTRIKLTGGDAYGGKLRHLSFVLCKGFRRSSTLMNKDLPSSPNPFSQIWEKGSETIKVPLPSLGEGFRVRAKTRVLNLDEVYLLAQIDF